MLSNKNKKLFIIAFVLLVVGVLVSIVSSFHSGTKQHSLICDLYINSSENLNIYGFKNCDTKLDQLYFSNPIYGFYLTTWFVLLLLLSTTKNKNDEKKYYLYGVGTFVTLLFVTQVLLNTFQYITYDGWQDAGWAIRDSTDIVQIFKDKNQNIISPKLFIITITTIFSFISMLGPFLASKMLKKNKTGNFKKNLLFYFKFTVLAIALQFSIFIAMFPITILFGLGWGN